MNMPEERLKKHNKFKSIFHWKTLKDQKKEGESGKGRAEKVLSSSKMRQNVDLIVEKSQVLSKWEIISRFFQSSILSRNRQHFMVKKDLTD